ncbi:MAG: TIGR02996 domain-containing protein [Planctomycetales bacterium]
MDDGTYLDEILENPDDDAPRLAAAERLERMGDPRGAFIRSQLQRERLDPGSIEARVLGECERQLLKKYKTQWAGRIGEITPRYEFRRGFISSVNLGLKRFIEVADLLFDSAPINSLGLRQCNTKRMKILAECPRLARVHELRLAKSTMNAKAAEALFHSPHWTWVSRFHAYQGQFGGDVTRVLASGPAFANLTSLYLGSEAGHVPDVESITACCRKLTSLNLLGSEIGNQGAAIIAKSGLKQLETLNLCDTGLGAAGMKALGQADLPALTRLDAGFGTGGGKYLAGPNIRQLRRLSLASQDLKDSDVRRLAEAELPDLEYLDLRRGLGLAHKSIACLAESRLLSQLEFLRVSVGKKLRKKDFVALAESPHLGQRSGVLHLPIRDLKSTAWSSLEERFGTGFFRDALEGLERADAFVEPATTLTPSEIARQGRD